MNNRFVKIAIHLVVIVMIFILPEIVMSGDKPMHHHDGFNWVPYIKVGIFVVVFYLEYLLMSPSTSRTKLIAGSCVIFVAGVICLYLMFENHHPAEGPHHPPRAIPVIIRDCAMLLLTMSLSVAMRLSERVRLVEESHREEELKQLKSQLNPHFLLNSLNTVYALTEIDPPGAREAVHRLSALLRYALYEADSPTVKLGREVAFINDYVRLMQMRLGESVTVKIVEDIAPGMENVVIASMLFVTLVENAFKHGSTGYPDAYVSIRISANAHGEVECDVANSVSGTENAAGNGGMGLENLRRRLRLIYGDKARLEISSQPAIFVAQMRIEL